MTSAQVSSITSAFDAIAQLQARLDILEARVAGVTGAHKAYVRALEDHADAVQVSRFAAARGKLTAAQGHKVESAAQTLSDARLLRDIAVARLGER